SNISQGQRQLLTIARAMLADSPMMILDEATSSVDTRTEILIHSSLAELIFLFLYLHWTSLHLKSSLENQLTSPVRLSIIVFVLVKYSTLLHLIRCHNHLATSE